MGLFDQKKKDNEENVTEEIDKLFETVSNLADQEIANQPELSEEEERKQHVDALVQHFLLQTEWRMDELERISIQDICVLIANGRIRKSQEKRVEEANRLTDLVDTFYDVLTEKLKTAPMLYTLLDETTGYPYIDAQARDCIWLFSEKKFAEMAIEHYNKSYRKFQLHELPLEGREEFLKEAFYLQGCFGVYVDNGLCGCLVDNDDLVPVPQWTQRASADKPLANPDFMRAHLKMVQEAGWHVKYDHREQVMEQLEQEVSRQIVETYFLLPVKGVERNREHEDQVILDQNTTLSIVCLKGKDGTQALPVFTDWVQFKRCYSDEEYSGWIVPFDLLAKMVEEKRYDAFVVNLGKCPAEIRQANIERMREKAKEANRKIEDMKKAMETGGPEEGPQS